MLYAFALTKTLGSVLYKLPAPDHCYIVYSNNIEHYLDILLHDKPEKILGMGIYTGKDQDKIRIETVANNKFRNDAIDPDLPQTVEINPFLQPISNDYKYASALGNSWCNYISWQIMKLITQKKLNSQYTFLHIPDGFSFSKKVALLNKLLEG